MRGNANCKALQIINYISRDAAKISYRFITSFSFVPSRKAHRIFERVAFFINEIIGSDVARLRLWKARDSIDYARIHDADHAACCAHSRIFPDLTSRGSFAQACLSLSLSLFSFDKTSFKFMTRTHFISLSQDLSHSVQANCTRLCI